MTGLVAAEANVTCLATGVVGTDGAVLMARGWEGPEILTVPTATDGAAAGVRADTLRTSVTNKAWKGERTEGVTFQQTRFN